MSTLSNLRVLLPETSVRNLLVGGTAILAVGFGGMTAWAAFAPLHSAVSAAGVLVPETGRKNVKHSEGGVISEMMVREGDTVKAGQVLMRFDTTEAATRLEMLTATWLENLTMMARLDAELFEKPAIEWPQELAARGDSAAVVKLVGNQQKLFDVRRQQLSAEEGVLRERIATLEEDSKNLSEQRKHLAEELKLSNEDVKINQGLLDRGNTTRTRLVEAQKENARIRGRDAELESRIAQNKQQALEAKADIVKRRNDFREKVLVDLDKARGETAKLAEQMRDAANRLANRDVKAPDAGIVVMQGHPTSGVAIAPNEPILDVVPADKTLLAEVHVQPKDIKSVMPDLPVKVQLTAYDSRVLGTLDGTVEYVSADRLTDQQTRQDYFLTRIRLKDGGAHTVHNLSIRAGMPVEARILLAGRTPLDYIVQPLSQSYLKAFIQQ
ncbi:HlyD family type I secretion periplasmic adaptor subunit [Azospirillum sp.]|uniref:HlyD family type I secretion periplasmic adaptor subunit n=1 Tax=Azospirillum sp. TaxID=34012 RepID=UPI003D71926B